MKKVPRLPSCVFHLYCAQHHNLPPLFICRKHAATFSHKKNLIRHIRNYFCGDDDGDTCLPVLDDTVFEEEETVPPPDIDSDQDIVDPPLPLLDLFLAGTHLIPL